MDLEFPNLWDLRIWDALPISSCPKILVLEILQLHGIADISTIYLWSIYLAQSKELDRGESNCVSTNNQIVNFREDAVRQKLAVSPIIPEVYFRSYAPLFCLPDKPSGTLLPYEFLEGRTAKFIQIYPPIQFE